MLNSMSKKEVCSMYFDLEFKSVFGKYFVSFYKEQQALGFSAKGKIMFLKVFDNYFYSRGFTSTFISESIYNEMITYLTEEEGRDKYRYSQMFAQVMKYMARLGNPVYIPRVRKHPKNRYIPYIYTHDEISRIFEASNLLRIKRAHNRAMIIIMPALIRMLYSTGIRVGEALALLNEDVDFERKTITLKVTKNRQPRIAPINSSLDSILKQYIKFRNKTKISGIDAPSSPFFTNTLGEPCTVQAVRFRFVEILNLAGIKYKGCFQGPRVHDLRHTACVHAMVKMVKSGKDIYCAMPYIAAYMGHRSLESTNYYLRLTAEMYPDIIEACKGIDELLNSSVYDNINFEDNE